MTSCEAYSEVLAQMRQRMSLGGYAKSTIISYVRAVRDLMEDLGKTPDKCTEEEVIAHLNSFREQKNMSPSALNTGVFGILYLYREVLKDKQIRLDIPNPGRGKTIGDILTPTELEALFAACHYPRQSAVLHLLYDTGLRAREVANLRLGDFDKKKCGAVRSLRQGRQAPRGTLRSSGSGCAAGVLRIGTPDRLSFYRQHTRPADRHEVCTIHGSGSTQAHTHPQKCTSAHPSAHFCRALHQQWRVFGTTPTIAGPRSPEYHPALSALCSHPAARY